MVLNTDLKALWIEKIYPKIWESVKTLKKNELYGSLSILAKMLHCAENDLIPDAFFEETFNNLRDLGDVMIKTLNDQILLINNGEILTPEKNT